MAEEPGTPVEEQPKAEEQPKEQEQPKEEAKPERKRNDVAELQRRKDREVAEARREAKTASERASQLESELGEVRTMLKEIREQANITDDDEARIKRLAEKERLLSDREAKAASYEKRVAARYLSTEYGIPVDDLLEYDDPRDMEIAALKWERDHRVSDDDDDKQPEPSAKAKDEPPSGYDFGGGGIARKSVADMTEEEFKEHHKRELRRAMARRR